MPNGNTTLRSPLRQVFSASRYAAQNTEYLASIARSNILFLALTFGIGPRRGSNDSARFRNE